MFADLNGDGKADVCARGASGIICALSTGTGFGTAFLALNQFTDAQGWNQVPLTGSLRLADVNGDGKPDICGRGTDGVECGLGNGDGTFATPQVWLTNFSDSNGWNQAQYGSTLMFADLNGDGKADVCARGASGIICALSTGTGFGTAFFSPQPVHGCSGVEPGPVLWFASLADVNGDGRPDICGRGTDGFAVRPR